MEELELSEQCRQGNNHARKELYEQYAGRMLGICLRYAGDRDTAQDLLHDSFIKIFDSFDKFTWRGEGSLRAWMERVVVNIALQYLRKNDVINQAASLEELVPCGRGCFLACIAPTTLILPFAYTRVYLKNAVKIKILHRENNSFSTFISLTDANAIFLIIVHLLNTK